MCREVMCDVSQLRVIAVIQPHICPVIRKLVWQFRCGNWEDRAQQKNFSNSERIINDLFIASTAHEKHVSKSKHSSA